LTRCSFRASFRVRWLRGPFAGRGYVGLRLRCSDPARGLRWAGLAAFGLAPWAVRFRLALCRGWGLEGLAGFRLWVRGPAPCGSAAARCLSVPACAGRPLIGSDSPRADSPGLRPASLPLGRPWPARFACAKARFPGTALGPLPSLARVCATFRLALVRCLACARCATVWRPSARIFRLRGCAAAGVCLRPTLRACAWRRVLWPVVGLTFRACARRRFPPTAVGRTSGLASGCLPSALPWGQSD